MLAAAGDAVFSNLGLLFALGVAVGHRARESRRAGSPPSVGFLVATKGAESPDRGSAGRAGRVDRPGT
jgi:PTS system N-acetylglucosamine-specific IIC component